MTRVRLEEAPTLNGHQEDALDLGTAGIIGLGYVGLPTAVAAARAGWQVVGFDIDPERVNSLNSGASHVADVDSHTLAALVEERRFRATTDTSRIAECDVVLICVPTPINRSREPDLTAVVAASRAVRAALRHGQLVILESTTYPGTTVEVVQPILEESGLKATHDFLLAFAPERLEPGNMRFALADIPKVVGGLTPAATERAVQFYSAFIRTVVPVSSPTAAEMVKIYENVFRCINIAFVNELALLCSRMGLDVWEIIDAAATKPYGFMPFYPGPGLGGHCIPVDPHYLAWKAKHYDFHVKFIELAASINDSMPYFVLERVMTALNDQGKCLRGARVLVLGVTYKRDVDDIRESPALKVMELLHGRGAEVAFHDPFVESVDIETRDGTVAFHRRQLSPQLVHSADCCVIITDHSSYDWTSIAEHARLIVDTRNALRDHRDKAPHAYSL